VGGRFRQLIGASLPGKRIGSRCCALRLTPRALDSGVLVQVSEYQADYAKICNEVAGISRVVYDISGKPPATIEWE
jgi:hypothetical protein